MAGYTKGIKWNNNLIEQGIKDVMYTLNLDRMPCHNEIINTKLADAINRYGGFRSWADKLGLKGKENLTKFRCKQ